MKLQTNRLIMRPYEESDLPDYYWILSNSRNLYYLDDIVTETMESARQSLHESIVLMKSGDARRFAITLKGQVFLGGKLIR